MSSKARAARAEMNKIWGSPEACSHAHAKRVYELLNEMEADELAHRAFVLAAARVVKAYLSKPSTCAGGNMNCRWSSTESIWASLIELVDAEVQRMTR